MTAERVGRTRSSASVQLGPQRTGQPLELNLRAQLEPLFQHSFADVRVFDDAEADRETRGFNAAAFAIGNELHFSAGIYQPHSPAGQYLLAHELAHTVQQSGSSSQPASRNRDIGLESEASRASSRVLLGQSAGVTAGSSGLAVQCFGWNDLNPFSSRAAPSGKLPDNPLTHLLAGGVETVKNAHLDNLEMQGGLADRVIDGAAGLVQGVPVLGDVGQSWQRAAHQIVGIPRGFAKGGTELLAGGAQTALEPQKLIEDSIVNAPAGPAIKAYQRSRAAGDGWGETLLETGGAYAGKGLGNARKAVHGYEEDFHKGRYGDMVGRGLADFGALLLGGEAVEASEVATATESAETVPRAPTPEIPPPAPDTIPAPEYNPALEPTIPRPPRLPSFPEGPGYVADLISETLEQGGITPLEPTLNPALPAPGFKPLGGLSEGFESLAREARERGWLPENASEPLPARPLETPRVPDFTELDRIRSIGRGNPLRRWMNPDRPDVIR